jgi:hypothetical protein
MFLHFVDSGTRRLGFLMPRGPDQQIQENGGQIDALLGQAVVHFSTIGLLVLGRDDSGGLQFLETVRQNIAGDPFPGFQKLFIRSIAANHQISHDEQRPAIAQHFQRNAYRAPGSSRGLPLSRHGVDRIILTCILQVNIAWRKSYFWSLPVMLLAR